MSAFRCKSCGHIHPSDHAGESDLPHACVVCGAGVTFTPKGAKTLQPENWEVLADVDDARLTELGLERTVVRQHVPMTPEESLANAAAASRQSLAAITAKESAWAGMDKAAHQRDIDAVVAEMGVVQAKFDAKQAANVVDASLLERREHLRQRVAALQGREFTHRDKAHRSHILSKLDELGIPRSPQHISVSAAEGTIVKDR